MKKPSMLENLTHEEIQKMNFEEHLLVLLIQQNDMLNEIRQEIRLWRLGENRV